MSSAAAHSKRMLREFNALEPGVDPVEVEMLTSALLGDWRYEEDQVAAAAELVDHVKRKPSPGAAALLAGLRTVAPEPEVREVAAGGLDAITARGIPEPDYARDLGQVTVEQCWRLGDVFGDHATVLCVFGYGGRRHGLVGHREFARPETALPEVALVFEPDQLLDGFRDDAREHEGVVELTSIDPGQARRLIEDGIAAMDATGMADPDGPFVDFRAVALARCRAMPTVAPAPPAQDIGDIEPVVDEFFAESEEVSDTDAARGCVRLLIDYGVEREPHQPLRVGPAKLLAFHEDVRSMVDLDEDEAAVLPDVLVAWANWAGRRQGLAASNVIEMVVAVGRGLAEQDAAESDEGERWELYLQDIPEITEPDELTEVLDRRMFAVPTLHTEIAGEHLTLEPDDPEQRQLLVVGEHPEYHDALAEEDPEIEVDGVPVHMHLALKSAVISHLWDDDPPEAWQAAQRLREAGLERGDVLNELALTLAEQMAPASADEELGYDLDGYRAALTDLG